MDTLTVGDYVFSNRKYVTILGIIIGFRDNKLKKEDYPYGEGTYSYITFDTDIECKYTHSRCRSFTHDSSFKPHQLVLVRNLLENNILDLIYYDYLTKISKEEADAILVSNTL